MSNALIVGDIHVKPYILDAIDKKFRSGKTNAHTMDRIILLGDYMDDWHASSQDRLDMARSLYDHVQAWKHCGISVDVCLGNHDAAYYLGRHSRSFPIVEYRSPGFDDGYEHEIHGIFNSIDFSIMTTIVINGTTWFCSHAGLTEQWWHHCLHYCDAQDIIERINGCNWHQLFMCGAGRGGYDRYSSPLWADKSELCNDPAHDLHQIVGHTPVSSATLVSTLRTQLLFADTFSTYESGEHIGDCSVVVVNTDDTLPSLATDIHIATI